LFEERQSVAREIGALEGRLRERAQELEFLTLGIGQIEAADPAPGDEDDLRAESERLTHGTDLLAAAAEAAELLGGVDDAYAAAPDSLPVAEAVGRARATLAHAGVNDTALAALATRVAELGHLVNDLLADLADYRTGIEVDPGRADVVEERRAVLAVLARKYGPTMADVLQWAKEAAVRADELAGTDDRLDELRTRIGVIDTDLAAAALTLTTARGEAAIRLGSAVTKEMGHLAMGKASIVVAVEPRTAATREGADDVEIRLAANPGATARSVARAASGGELSRVMLAIEVVTADRAGLVPTYVFDEVDAGIGGRAALDVGSRLAALALHAQVVVVTHLPQVAAYADRHLVVTKASDGRVTSSGVVEVSGAAREAELSRMMAGVQSDTALLHARELLAEVATRRA
ncbi:MAG: DNA repair protein RecN, partial [Nostocoides sp.]